MNPLSTKIKEVKLAPMREVSKTLQIRWYRCPVDKKILRDLMTPSDAHGLFMSLGHLSLWLATGGVTFYLFSQQMGGRVKGTNGSGGKKCNQTSNPHLL